MGWGRGQSGRNGISVYEDLYIDIDILIRVLKRPRKNPRYVCIIESFRDLGQITCLVRLRIYIYIYIYITRKVKKIHLHHYFFHLRRLLRGARTSKGSILGHFLLRFVIVHHWVSLTRPEEEHRYHDFSSTQPTIMYIL